LESQRQRQLSQTLVNQGIHAVARLNGGEYVIEENLQRLWRVRGRNLDELVESAPVVVLGTVQSAAPRTTADGRSIETLYELSVIETLRGATRGSITVRVTGGRMEFPDGAVAEVRTPGFSIAVGKAYLLFLRPPSTSPVADQDNIARDVHVLAVGPQGVFDMSTARVQSLARADDVIRVQHDGREAQAFLTEVRATIQKVESTPR
jgi:hypothetical protein